MVGRLEMVSALWAAVPTYIHRVEWDHLLGRKEILGKILLITTYLTNNCLSFDWTAAIQPDIHKVREYGRDFIHNNND